MFSPSPDVFIFKVIEEDCGLPENQEGLELPSELKRSVNMGIDTSIDGNNL